MAKDKSIAKRIRDVLEGFAKKLEAGEGIEATRVHADGRRESVMIHPQPKPIKKKPTRKEKP